MAYFEITKDYETSESAGAGGMFQIETLKLNGRDVTDRVDVGLHFSCEDPEELREYLRKIFNIPKNKGIDIEEV